MTQANLSVNWSSLGFWLCMSVLVVGAFKCNGIVLWGPNERPEKCPEVAEP